MKRLLKKWLTFVGFGPSPCSPRVKFLAGIQDGCDGWAQGTGDSPEEAISDFLDNYGEDLCNERLADEEWDRKLSIEVWECKHVDDCTEGELWNADESWTWIGQHVVDNAEYRCKEVPNPKYPDLPDWEFFRENSTSDSEVFQREYLGVPCVQTPEEKQLHELAHEYHVRTEAYDRIVCRGPVVHGAVMPASGLQVALVSKHARSVHRELRDKAAALGFTPEQWQKAVHEAQQ